MSPNPTDDVFHLTKGARMNRDAIKQAAAMIEELERVESDIRDIDRNDIEMQVILREPATNFTRLTNVQKPEVLAILNAKRDAVIKSLERRGVDFASSGRPDELAKPIPAAPPHATKSGNFAG